MYCEDGEGRSPEEEGHTSSLQSVEEDDSGSWPHSYPAYFPRFNLANKPKSRLGRRHVTARLAPVRLDEGRQTSENVCSEQKSGSTPFLPRSSGMAWLRETPIKSIYPTAPALDTRDNVDNAKLGYNPSHNIQRGDNKSNTEVDPLSFHSALFSNTTEKSVHSLFNPTLGLKNIFKNTPFKGSENENNILNNINQQGKNSAQIKRDGNLRIKLFENSGDDKENISDNLKPMDRKLIEINSNTQGLFSDMKSSLNTEEPLDLSSGHSHSGNSNSLLEMNVVDGFHRINATDENNDVLKTDKIISNLPNGVENKLHHSSYPAVLFRKPFDSVINKNYVLIPGSEKIIGHNQQDHDQKHLSPLDTQGVIRESHTTNNSLSINCVTEVKNGARNSDEFINGSDDSSKTTGPTTIKVGTGTIPVVTSQGQSMDKAGWTPDLNQQQNMSAQQNLSTQQNGSQHRLSKQVPTIFSHRSAPNQNKSIPLFHPYSNNVGKEAIVGQKTSDNNAVSNPIPGCGQKGSLVFNRNNQFKMNNSCADALKQVASKIVLPSQKTSDNVSVKGDSSLQKQCFSAPFPAVGENELQNEISRPNIKETQPLETRKTLNENFLNKNLNTAPSFTHNQESRMSVPQYDSLLENEVPVTTEAANIKSQTLTDYQHPNYLLVGECKPQYLSKQERVTRYRSTQRPNSVCSQQLQSETTRIPEDVHSQQSLPETQPVSLHTAPAVPICEQVNAKTNNELNSFPQYKQVASSAAEHELVHEIIQGPGEPPSQQPNTVETQIPSPESGNNNMLSSGDNMVFAKPAIPPFQKSCNILPTVKQKQPLPKTRMPSAATNVQNNFKYAVPENTQPQQTKTLTVNGKAYTVLSMLGRGGSSEVYQVLDPVTSLLMAVKCVNLSIVDPVIAEGYLNEIELLSMLQGCESVIRMFDHEYLKETKMLYVVMEKGDTDLSKLIRDISKTKKIPVSMVIHYWTEMLTAVKDIHDRGIIHSDLKPANFLLVSGRLKLIDFGIASSLQGDMTSVHKELTTGTWNYMSPEAFNNTGGSGRGVKITYKSDVWSLGCILYNLLYGKTPFSHIKRTWDKVLAILDPNHEIDFPNIGVPVVLDRALKSCFHRDPKQRPSVAQLLDMPYHTNIDPEYISKQLQSILPLEYWNAVAHLFNEKKIQQEGPNTDNKKID